MTDLKFAFRQLLKNPGFTAVAVLTLALGIGANVAVFSLVRALHFVPLPVREPDELVAVLVPGTGDVFSETQFDALREQIRTFSGIAAHASTRLVVRRGDMPTRRTIAYVTPEYFELLGVHAQRGRTLSASDRKTPHLVISETWWEREFQRDPAVIGKGIEIEGKLFTIVGVAPPRFVGLVPAEPVEGWIPHELEADLGRTAAVNYGGGRWLQVFARMHPGVSLEAATDSVRSIEGELLLPWMIERRLQIQLVPCGRGVMPPQQRREGVHLSLLTSLVMALVLVVVTVNLALLLLGRGLGRRREFAVRQALGASRGRVVGQLLMEGLPLALAGGGLGFLVSIWGVRGLLLLVPQMVSVGVEIPVSMAGFGFALGLSMLTVLLFSLVPAFRSTRAHLHEALKDEIRGLGVRTRWFDPHNLVITSQVAICVALTVATGLVWQDLQKRRSLETGFNPRNMVVASLWEREPSTSPEIFTARLETLRTEIEALPGVQSATLAQSPPMGPQIGVSGVSAGFGAGDRSRRVTVNIVSPGFFDTLQVPVLAGRDFSVRDRQESERLAIVSERLAEALYPNGNALGRPLNHAGVVREIIGIVGEVRHMRIEQPDLIGSLYVSSLQSPFDRAPHLLVRADRSDRALGGLVATSVRRADPGRQVHPVRAYGQYMDDVLMRHRATMRMVWSAALVAVGLLSLGLYGVVGYQVSQRTREIGVRMALGALKRDVLILILRRGLVLIGVGTVLGWGLSMAVAQLLGNVLYGVSTVDLSTCLAAAALLVGVGVAACWLPARRASRVDPMIALRTE
jgi:putative ABC transport system permease protein